MDLGCLSHRFAVAFRIPILGVDLAPAEVRKFPGLYPESLLLK